MWSDWQVPDEIRLTEDPLRIGLGLVVLVVTFYTLRALRRAHVEEQRKLAADQGRRVFIGWKVARKFWMQSQGPRRLTDQREAKDKK
jgi:hypothetical protein